MNFFRVTEARFLDCRILVTSMAGRAGLGSRACIFNHSFAAAGRIAPVSYFRNVAKQIPGTRRDRSAHLISKGTVDRQFLKCLKV